ncbi:Uncharacterised protein [Vibrio cholerae]|nr:hypothetical protein VCHC02A1_2455 [Vibrio cholerae HC-02A1]CSA02038.1 Uncharacterised protein [Vibrio cholerae]CSB61796.1 Uncharacterised protein [Vibrio cholerae]CSC08935.1 Uncharacterised protein [Vibrio cholerae]CSC22057.1 Uncharacterised protein [Vibrio cholerae]
MVINDHYMARFWEGELFHMLDEVLIAGIPSLQSFVIALWETMKSERLLKQSKLSFHIARVSSKLTAHCLRWQ